MASFVYCIFSFINFDIIFVCFRVRAGGIDVSGLSGGNPSYGYPSYREESDYYSSSETDNYSSPGYSNAGYPSKTGYNNMGGGSSGGGGKFCHECGTKYPVSSAKFCCECGVRRMMMSWKTWKFKVWFDWHEVMWIFQQAGWGIGQAGEVGTGCEAHRRFWPCQASSDWYDLFLVF